jgi:hypothetical protein
MTDGAANGTRGDFTTGDWITGMSVRFVRWSITRITANMRTIMSTVITHLPSPLQPTREGSSD